jgi:hypothetical protein
MPFYDTPPRVTDILAKLAGEQRRVSANRRVENAQISRGGITITDPTGSVVGRVGLLGDGSFGISSFDSEGHERTLRDAAEQVDKVGLDANNALTAANGKNKSTFDDEPPGAAENTAGDIWFQRDMEGNILGQWEGMGGTTWSPRQLASEIIANLDAGKITTGTLDADRIGAGTIVAGHLATDSVTTDKLAANAIDGMVITGATLRTAASGPRVTLTSAGMFGAGLYGWQGSTVNPNVLLSSIGLTIQDVDESTPGYTKVEGVRVSKTGIILSKINPAMPVPFQSVMRMFMGLDSLTFYDETSNRRIALGNDRAEFWNAANTEKLTIRTGSTFPQQRIESNNALALYGGGIEGLNVQTSGVAFGNYLYANYFRTTTSAANLHRSSADAQIYLVTSNGHNKLEQEAIPLCAGEALLEVPPKTWVDRREAESGNQTRVPGFVAEDVKAVSDAHGGALAALLTEGPDSMGTSYMGVNYDRVAAYLIPVIRDLRSRITELERALND